MRTLLGLLFGLLLATMPVFGQDKSAITTSNNPAASPVVQNTAPADQEWTLVAYYDGDIETGGSEQAKVLQRRLLRWAEKKAKGHVFLEKLNIRDNNKGTHAMSPKETFEKVPGAMFWKGRIATHGDVLVQRFKYKNGQYLSESFPILLGSPLEPDEVLDGLLKPVRLAEVERSERTSLALRPTDISPSTSAGSSSSPPAPAAPPAGTRIVSGNENK